jgi:hypothetical protein
MLLEKKNVNKMQRWRNEFSTPPPKCITVE